MTDIHRALADPEEVFARPEDVPACPDLSADDKRAVLRAWEDQVRELMVAEEENMRAPPGAHCEELLQRIVQARIGLGE